MAREEVPKEFEEWSNLWNLWDEWKVEQDVSALEACLSYVSGTEGIDKIVVELISKSSEAGYTFNIGEKCLFLSRH